MKIGGATGFAIRFSGPFTPSSTINLTSVSVKIRWHIEGLVSVGAKEYGTLTNGNLSHPSGGLVCKHPEAMDVLLNLSGTQNKFKGQNFTMECAKELRNVARAL